MALTFGLNWWTVAEENHVLIDAVLSAAYYSNTKISNLPQFTSMQVK